MFEQRGGNTRKCLVIMVLNWSKYLESYKNITVFSNQHAFCHPNFSTDFFLTFLSLCCSFRIQGQLDFTSYFQKSNTASFFPHWPLFWSTGGLRIWEKKPLLVDLPPRVEGLVSHFHGIFLPCCFPEVKNLCLRGNAFFNLSPSPTLCTN